MVCAVQSHCAARPTASGCVKFVVLGVWGSITAFDHSLGVRFVADMVTAGILLIFVTLVGVDALLLLVRGVLQLMGGGVVDRRQALDLSVVVGWLHILALRHCHRYDRRQLHRDEYEHSQ